MFNGGSRRRLMIPSISQPIRSSTNSKLVIKPRASSPGRTIVPLSPTSTSHIASTLTSAPPMSSTSLSLYSPFVQSAASSLLHYEWLYRYQPGMLGPLSGYGVPGMWMTGSMQPSTRNFEPWSWIGSPASAFERGRLTEVAPEAPPINSAKPPVN